MKLSHVASTVLTAVVLSACTQGDDRGDNDAEDSQDLTARYSARISTMPATIVAGSPASVGVQIFRSTTAVTAFDDLHTQKLHFIAISSDLEDIVHVHPVLGASGHFTTSTTFAKQQPYSVFLEYDPAGRMAAQTTRSSLTPASANAVAPSLVNPYDGSGARTSTIGTTRVRLAKDPSGMVMPKMAAHLSFHITTATGTPATDLVPWLGMPAHGIIVSEDVATFLHVHGMADTGGGGMHMDHGTGAMTAGTTGMDMDQGAMPMPTDGRIGVDVTFPRAGLYKMFLQFQRGAAVVTAPFVIRVMAM